LWWKGGVWGKKQQHVTTLESIILQESVSYLKYDDTFDHSYETKQWLTALNIICTKYGSCNSELQNVLYFRFHFMDFILLLLL